METTDLRVITISPEDIPYYSDKDIAYQKLDKRYDGFYRYRPLLSEFSGAIKNRQKFNPNRDVLKQTIADQYRNVGMSAEQKAHWEKLTSDRTFTVITAHQPSLFTGPLYFVFKICSAIKLSEQIQESYPEFHIVPVFISGGEDHDFEEINHTQLFGKKVEWKREGGGPVGRMVIAEDFRQVMDEFLDILGERNYGLEISSILRSCLKNSQTYADFNFRLVNQLFSKYGVLVVNMDHPELKGVFKPVMKDELIKRPSRELVLEAQKKLEKKGFSSQAFPREINLFYLQQDRRDRIEYNNGRYEVVDTSINFSEDEILQELDSHPERFSPNVIMRPLYQEYIFPNLAYIGGGGEIAYWLERLDQFNHFQIPFPVLIRRDSAMLVPAYIQKQWQELGLNYSDTLKPVNDIINHFLAQQTAIEISLSGEKAEISEIFEKIAKKADAIDPPIAKWILAEATKMEKLVDQMESRIKRSIKKREENKVAQIQKTKEKLYPDNNLQERKENFFQFYLTEGPELIDDLIRVFDPLDAQFRIIEL